MELGLLHDFLGIFSRETKHIILEGAHKHTNSEVTLWGGGDNSTYTLPKSPHVHLASHAGGHEMRMHILGGREARMLKRDRREVDTRCTSHLLIFLTPWYFILANTRSLVSCEITVQETPSCYLLD